MGNWTTPADIRAELERLWTRGQLLGCVLHKLNDHLVMNERGRLTGEPPPLVFPYKLRLRRPRANELGSSFEAVRAWVRSLEAASRSETGSGFDIAWEEVNTRQLGRNRLPAALTLQTLDEALAAVGKRVDADRFTKLAVETVARFPELGEWIARKPLVVLEHQAVWLQVLDVITWFASHPRSGLYVRQIDVRGVDTKFIEPRRALLGELLDLVLPVDAIEQAVSGAHPFETRYGLAAKPALVRFRLLDPELEIAGLTDLSVPVSEFANLAIAAKRVFIVENEITGLAFPNVPDSMLIFGGGYSVDRLAAAGWLGSRKLFYWSDIDTHGFAILDRLRAFLPCARSLLMDRATLLAHRALWGFEAAPQTADLGRLDAEERSLYDALRYDGLGSGVRLEQERVPFSFALRAILDER
jgi:hypothetical protein